MRISAWLFLLAPLAGCTAQHTTPAPIPKPQALAAAVQKFLDDKGGYCVGKPDWPRLVTDLDRRKHRPDALQMPVLEHLGVVSAAPVPGDPTSTQYSLTDAGRKFYVDYRPRIAPAAVSDQIQRPGDLCVARLRVLDVTKWTPVRADSGSAATMVSYTYEIALAAPWTNDPDFRRVFPVVAGILAGGDKLEMMLPLRWSGRSWVAAVSAR